MRRRRRRRYYYTHSLKETLRVIYPKLASPIQFRTVAWPSGLRRWFKAPVSSEARVRIPPLPINFKCKTKQRSYGNPTAKKSYSGTWVYQQLLAPRSPGTFHGFVVASVRCLLQGSVAEWSKALVLGTSLFGGVGSNPTAAKMFCACWHKFV